MNSVDNNDRHICTKGDPWTPEKSKRAQHPDAVHIGTCPDQCCDDYRCPHCGKEFRVELPQ